MRVGVARELPGDTKRQKNVTTCKNINDSTAENGTAHLLGAHVEFGAHLARVPGQQRGRRQGAGPIFVLLLIHGRHQAEISDLHHVIHGEEDVGGLRDRLHKTRLEHNLLPVMLRVPLRDTSLDSLYVHIDFCSDN